MKSRYGRKRLFVVAVAIATLLGGCTGDDPLVGPTGSTNDYVFMFNGASTSQYWRYSITSQTLDTFSLSVQPVNAMSVSPDNKVLYVPQANATTVVSCDSLVTIENLPYSSRYGVAVSASGELVALHGEDVTRLVRTSDWSIVRTDSIVASHGVFSLSGELYYCTGAAAGETQAVHVIPTNPVYPTGRKALAGLTPDLIRLAPDGSRWYLYDGGAPNQATVAVYDVIADSVVATFSLPTANGEMTLSPDGARLFVSAPGSYGAYPPVYPSQKIFEFDTRIPALSREIDLTTIPVDSGIGPTDIARLTVSDDGSRLIGSSGYVLSYLLDLDIASLAATRLYDFGDTGSPYYMSD